MTIAYLNRIATAVPEHDVHADGAAASLITARKQGFALDSFKAVSVPKTRGLITWKIL